MRVFVAGATGVLGRALLTQLQAAGHEAVGLARTPEKLLLVHRLGAQAVRGDVLDAETMRRLVQETRPDAIVNLATAVPRKLRVGPRDWEQNDRVRVEGTTNLLAAAQEGDVQLFVQESVGYVCESRGDDWIDEDAPRTNQAFLRATVQMEDLTRASRVPAALLRLAALNSADAWHTQQSIAALRRGLLPIVGEGSAFLSLIHSEDAAHAVLCALANPRAAAGQTFNVVDDEPVRQRDAQNYAAHVLRAPAPKQIPPLVAKMVVGAFTVEKFTTSYRMRNAKIRRVLGFAPRYPTYRENWAQIVQEVGERDFPPAEEWR
jgi:nucleoside-diphosphate-sugar epimerase